MPKKTKKNKEEEKGTIEDIIIFDKDNNLNNYIEETKDNKDNNTEDNIEPQEPNINIEIDKKNFNKIENYEKNTDQETKAFNEVSISKVFSVIDSRLSKLDKNFKLENEEKKSLAKAWTDAANVKFREVNQEEAIYSMAVLITSVVYLPRIIEYIIKIKNKKSVEQKNSNYETNDDENEDNINNNFEDIYINKK